MYRTKGCSLYFAIMEASFKSMEFMVEELRISSQEQKRAELSGTIAVSVVALIVLIEGIVLIVVAATKKDDKSASTTLKPLKNNAPAVQTLGFNCTSRHHEGTFQSVYFFRRSPTCRSCCVSWSRLINLLQTPSL